MSKWIVDIHGEIEGDYEIIEKYEEPKTGHWIEGKYRDSCDKCRCTYPKNIGIKKYCPNCGTKMESEE